MVHRKKSVVITNVKQQEQ